MQGDTIMEFLGGDNLLTPALAPLDRSGTVVKWCLRSPYLQAEEHSGNTVPSPQV